MDLIKDVIFGGENSKVIFLSSTFFGYAAQLTMRRSIDLDFAFSSLFYSYKKFENMVEVIQAFLFA